MELLTAVAVTSTFLLASTPTSPAAETLARQIEERHLGVVDLTARFVQTYRSGALGRDIVESGSVSLKPKGLMRWEYRQPERKIFVSDGKTTYFYVPADRQVIVRDGAGDKGVLALLLSGRGGILSHFDVTLEAARDGLRALRLSPKKPDPDVERVDLQVDQDLRIRTLEILDAQGNRSTFRFEDIRENVGLPDRLFRFEIPRGVEVITG